jgi:general secretion pathway protein F
MPMYRYEAYAADGALTKGKLKAANHAAAVDAVMGLGLIPFRTLAADGVSAPRWWDREVFETDRISLEDLSLFTRELATFVDADLPVDEALGIVASQSTRAAPRRFVRQVLDRVTEGAALSESLEPFRKYLPGPYISMIRAGEAGGNLGRVLGDLAHLLERSLELRGKLRSALVYPALLIVTSLVAFVVVLMVLVPSLKPLFDGTGAEPPMVMTGMAALHKSLMESWPIWLASIVVSLGGLVVAVRTPSVRAQLSRNLLRLPLAGPLAKSIETARFCRTLGTLLRSNVPLVEALTITADVASNPAFGAASRTLAQQVKQGRLLRQEVNGFGIFSTVATRLIAVGEESGRLEDMLLHGASILEGQSQRQIDRLMSLLVPVLTLVIGVGVGGLVMTVMNAILSINSLALQ